MGRLKEQFILLNGSTEPIFSDPYLLVNDVSDRVRMA